MTGDEKGRRVESIWIDALSVFGDPETRYDVFEATFTDAVLHQSFSDRSVSIDVRASRETLASTPFSVGTGVKIKRGLDVKQLLPDGLVNR